MGPSIGVYEVTESGLKFQHVPSDLPTPKDGEEFLKRFAEGFSMRVLERPSENELIFEMIGVDVSFGNALRRILISEIPTMAIETVFMWDNSSIIHDEVLAHRMGLIPIHVDARYFEPYEEEEESGQTTQANDQVVDDEADDGDDDPNGALIAAQNATDRNTIVFKLHVSCSRSEAVAHEKARATGKADDDAAEATVLENSELDEAALEAANLRHRAISTPGRPFTKHIYSRDLEWIPQGDQASLFTDIRPVYEDILIAKLRPGQTIELEAHARLGVGKDHAKFSPVATASYRLMTNVEIIKPIYDELAEQLVHLYEPGVFELEETTNEDPPNIRCKAKVVNPYACTMSRNYMRNQELAESIRMTRVPNHLIFSIESVGMISPAVLMSQALRVLQEKCIKLIALSDEYVSTLTTSQ